MAAERLSMRQLKEILRQKWVLGRPHRLIAQSVGVSPGSVGGAVCRATAAGLGWEQVEALDETALERRLYGPPEGTCSTVDGHSDPKKTRATAPRRRDPPGGVTQRRFFGGLPRFSRRSLSRQESASTSRT